MEEDAKAIEKLGYEKSDNSISDELKDIEGEQKKLKYPRSIIFIISNEFCERFNYYGMRTILVLYLTRKLDYDDDTATVLYHLFTMMVYFMCIFGAILADSWLGKFRTIFYLSIVYVCGSTVIALGAVPPLNLPLRTMTILGLSLIAVGSGGIKPCVAAFGGDQFKIPEQAKQLALFFSLFYFSINLGSLISTTVTPILREDVKCFDDDDCFSLAFGVPGALMIVSIFIFLFGRFLYVTKPPTGNMFVKVYRCITCALSNKRKEKDTNPREHWLDYAEKTHGRRLVDETKILLNVLVIYIPLPVFWALFDQQGSRWTFQATHMDGDIGFITIKPDQMQVINPLLILAFIPLYEVVFYPLLEKVGIKSPLQKLALGGIFAGLAFLASAFVEIKLSDTYATLPESGEAQIRIINSMPCNYSFRTDIPDHATINVGKFEMFTEMYVDVPDRRITFNYTAEPDLKTRCPPIAGTFHLESKTQTTYFIRGNAETVELFEYEDDTEKFKDGDPLVRILANVARPRNIALRDVKHKNYLTRYENETTVSTLVDLYATEYDVFIDKQVDPIGQFEMLLGGVYALIVYEDPITGEFELANLVITEENSMSMMWLIPQYVIMTLGEVMYSVTGLQFSYSQAPESMKSVLQGCWQLTVGFGNLIVVIIAEAKLFDSQTYEFLLFAGLMFVDMAAFGVLAYRYKAIPLKDDSEYDDEASTLPIENSTATSTSTLATGKPEKDVVFVDDSNKNKTE